MRQGCVERDLREKRSELLEGECPQLHSSPLVSAGHNVEVKLCRDEKIQHRQWYSRLSLAD